MFDGRFRSGVDRAVKPIGGALKGTGLSPDHLTALGLLLAFPAAAAIATGRLGLGLGLLIASAVPDLLDGALAKASGRASVRGAFFDSVADRVTDTVVLGGVAWYLLDRHHGHVALLPMAVLGASLLISYERAKAESLGFEAKGGLMERAERLVVLCVGLAFSFLLIPLLWLMLVLTVFTAVQRFVKVWRQATAAGHGPPPVQRPAFVRRSGYTLHRAGRRGRPLAGVAGGQRLGAPVGPLRRRLPPQRSRGPLAGAPPGPPGPPEGRRGVARRSRARPGDGPAPAGPDGPNRLKRWARRPDPRTLPPVPKRPRTQRITHRHRPSPALRAMRAGSVVGPAAAAVRSGAELAEGIGVMAARLPVLPGPLAGLGRRRRLVARPSAPGLRAGPGGPRPRPAGRRDLRLLRPLLGGEPAPAQPAARPRSRAGVRYEGFEHIQAGEAAGRGTILALPHLGGWEWGGAGLVVGGHALSVVVEALEPADVFEWFVSFRERLGMQVIPTGPGAAVACRRALAANHLLCLLSDRLVGGAAGVEVEFFGERPRCRPDRSPWRCGPGPPSFPAPSTSSPEPIGRLGFIRPPLQLARGGRLRDDVQRGTQVLARRAGSADRPGAHPVAPDAAQLAIGHPR